MSDYDFPKSLTASQAMEDYDYPRGGKRSGPTSHEGDRSLSAIPAQLKRASDSSQSSGSAYSGDVSSGSLDSSLYDLPKRTIVPQHTSTMSSQVRQSEINLDEELRKINGLMEEVTQQRLRVVPSASSANRVTLDGYEISGLGKHLHTGGESKRSSSSAQESLSSRSGSNDTLGVWDDVSFADEESSDECDSGVGDSSMNVGRVGEGESGEGGEKEGSEMLDTWIKELESGIQGMSNVVGIGGEKTVVSEGGKEGGRKEGREGGREGACEVRENVKLCLKTSTCIITLFPSLQLDPQTPTINPPSPVNKPLPPLPPSSHVNKPLPPIPPSSSINKPLPPPPTTTEAGSTRGEGGAPGNHVDKRRKSSRLTVLANEKVREKEGGGEGRGHRGGGGREGGGGRGGRESEWEKEREKTRWREREMERGSESDMEWGRESLSQCVV